MISFGEEKIFEPSLGSRFKLEKKERPGSPREAILKWGWAGVRREEWR